MDGGGMLSQDEINALLSGMNLSDDGDSGKKDASDSAAAPQIEIREDMLSDIERDAIGEVGNISMGSSATALFSLVNRKVKITTPTVTLTTWDKVIGDYEKPCVFIQIKYTVGLDGTNILVLKEQDVKVITDLMMGGDGTRTDGELGELELSAISEAMNQMMGSAATSLSTMLKKTIDISPPDSSLLDLTQVRNGGDIAPFLAGVFVKIAFRMQIDNLIDSSIIQMYPVDFAKDLVNTFINSKGDSNKGKDAKGEQNPAAGSESQAGQQDMNPQMMGMNPQMMGMNPQMMGMYPQMMGMNPQMMGMNPQMMGMYPQMGMPMAGTNSQQNMQNVNIQPAQFQSFGGDGRGIPGQENIGLIMDVPLEVTVELGRTKKSISEILNFAPGTIIELDRIAGEPIDVLVNGKFVARGEVVVIEESFGIRITEIIK
ncbi:MAG: flagellar motor switch phosphatase FliY [Roseburia sp.]|nr:flagellar motor switch phosphatase FliY [Roseburia sp.]MCM1096980.1 flagellar motor switch phosphatase FliY [Ruminococcus flavefaciens]